MTSSQHVIVTRDGTIHPEDGVANVSVEPSRIIWPAQTLAGKDPEGSSEAFEVIEPMAVSDGLTVAPASRDVKERAPSAVDRVREAAKVAAGTAGEATGWAARKSSEIMPSRADLGEAASAAKALASSTTAEATSVVAEWWGYRRGSAPAAAPPAAAQ